MARGRRASLPGQVPGHSRLGFLCGFPDPGVMIAVDGPAWCGYNIYIYAHGYVYIYIYIYLFIYTDIEI